METQAIIDKYLETGKVAKKDITQIMEELFHLRDKVLIYEEDLYYLKGERDFIENKYFQALYEKDCLQHELKFLEHHVAWLENR